MFDLFDLDQDGVVDPLEFALADELLFSEEEADDPPPVQKSSRAAAKIHPPADRSKAAFIPSTRSPLPSVEMVRRQFPRKKK